MMSAAVRAPGHLLHSVKDQVLEAVHRCGPLTPEDEAQLAAEYDTERGHDLSRHERAALARQGFAKGQVSYVGTATGKA